jgi:signal transduction histidine kinase/putative methionine-R-sulfoxide reductase with GAF domain
MRSGLGPRSLQEVVRYRIPSEAVDIKEHDVEISPSLELTALNAIGALAGESLDLEEILDMALDKVLEVMDVEVAYVCLVDEEAGKLMVTAHRGGGEDLVRQISGIKLGEGLAGRVAASGEPLVVEDVSLDPQLATTPLTEERIRGYAGVPLKSRGRVLGVMNVGSCQPRRFTPAHLRFLTTMAGHIGVAVENALLCEQLSSSQSRLRERVKELSLLYDVTTEALIAPDVSSLLSFVARQLPASMQYQQAVAVVCCSLDENDYLAWSDNIDKDIAERIWISPGEGTLGKLMIDEGVLLEYEIARLDAFWADCDVKSVLAVPVTVNGEAIGSICVYYLSDKWRYLEEEKQLLHGISEQIAQFIARGAVEREKLQRTREISTLFEVSKALASVVEVEKLLPAIAHILVKTLPPAEAGVLLIFDEGTGMLTVESSFGYDIGALRQISLQVGESMSGKVFKSRKPQVWATPEESASAMANMTDHNRVYFRQASGGFDHPKSAIGVPLVYREGKIGVLTLENFRNKGGLSISDLPFLQALAELTVINVDKIRLLQQTERTKAMEEADRLKSELIAALAHDMRTPLASIMGYASALLLDDVEWDEETRAEYLGIIDQEASELQLMIQDLLESSIVDAGLLQIDREPTLIPRLVEGLVQQMSRRTANHRFVISFPGGFPIVDADPRRIEQALRNLLDNAVKYSPEGGLVVVRGQAAHDEVIISVADEGVGIAPEHLNRLFEKFFRVKSPLGYQVRGSGLGLPVSRTIIESHGGRIWAESELGKGTTIYFSLPRTGLDTAVEGD